MSMKFGLKPHIIEAIQNCLKEFPSVHEAIVYGSRAKGNYRNGSDIDLTLKGKDLTLKILFSIEHKLDDLLLPYKIDLSLFNSIDNQDLIEHIERVGISFYNKGEQVHR